MAQDQINKLTMDYEKYIIELRDIDCCHYWSTTRLRLEPEKSKKKVEEQWTPPQNLRYTYTQ